jgi:hypothetical protein
MSPERKNYNEKENSELKIAHNVSSLSSINRDALLENEKGIADVIALTEKSLSVGKKD